MGPSIFIAVNYPVQVTSFANGLDQSISKSDVVPVSVISAFSVLVQSYFLFIENCFKIRSHQI